MRFEDPIVDQFIAVYGIRRLLEDLNLERITKMGPRLMARCPFHDNNREPDFQIHMTFGLWNCFGCQKQGNLYQFVAQAYQLSYKDANAYIQKLAGFDENFNVEDIKFRASMRNMLGGNVTVEDEKPEPPAITDAILARMNTGPDPYEYMLKRGFSEETIAKFGCTFTDKWRVWSNELDDYKFEERVVIPGHYENGEICGFIGRTPVGDEPKYRYTKGFPKNQTVFNLHRAKAHASKGIILVEGSLDTMQIDNLGWPNVGGIYGASISVLQVEAILRWFDEVFLAFDNDAAGRIATLKGIEAFKDVVKLNVIDLGSRKDPGEITDANEFAYMKRTAYNWQRFLLQSPFT